MPEELSLIGSSAHPGCAACVQRPLQGLAEILSAHNTPYSQQWDRCLQLGLRFIGGQLAVITRRLGEHAVLERVVSGEKDAPHVGQVMPVSETYCGMCIQSEATLALPFTQGTPWADHPSCRKSRMEAFLGTPIRVDGQIWGALGFCCRRPRVNSWTPTEIDIVELLAAWIGSTVYLRQAQQEASQYLIDLEAKNRGLDEINDHLTVINRIEPMTMFLTRDAWEEAIEAEHARARRTGSQFAVVMIDIDFFKRLNDSLGHQGGDNCLRALSTCMRSAVRSIDLLGRYGGEEFALLAPETDESGALAIAERIESAVNALAYPHPDSPLAKHVTISAGVAAGVPEDWEGLVRQADEALYRAKAEGRARVVPASDNAGTTTA